MHKHALINALPNWSQARILNEFQQRGWISDNTITWNDLSEYDAAAVRVRISRGEL
jgi:hypothetical protein